MRRAAWLLTSSAVALWQDEELEQLHRDRIAQMKARARQGGTHAVRGLDRRARLCDAALPAGNRARPSSDTTAAGCVRACSLRATDAQLVRVCMRHKSAA